MKKSDDKDIDRNGEFTHVRLDQEGTGSYMIVFVENHLAKKGTILENVTRTKVIDLTAMRVLHTKYEGRWIVRDGGTPNRFFTPEWWIEGNIAK